MLGPLSGTSEGSMTRLRAVSAKRRKVMRSRQEISKRLWDERGPWCQMSTPVCTGLAQGLHEIVGRAQGGSEVDDRNLLLAANSCNTWAEDNPARAREMGLKCPRWAAVDGDGGLVPSDEWLRVHGRLT